MGANSKIEWTDHTFNPWVGCTKVSPACDNCYAEAYAKRTGQAHLWQGERRRTSEANWRQPLKWDREAAAAGQRARVFCASLADVFDQSIDPVWRSDLFELIGDTPNLDWLLLTKRIGNVKRLCAGVSAWPNVWLGATVVNQEEADRDIPKLLATPARVRFLSIEPMLGPIDLTRVCDRSRPRGLWMNTLQAKEANPAHAQLVAQLGPHYPYARLDWVIVGGESGTHARPMHPDWVRSLRDQCAAAGVPFLFKQWGEYLPGDQPEIQSWTFEDDRGIHSFTVPSRTDADWAGRVGKKGAGRMLDGRAHDGFPHLGDQRL